MLIFNDVDILEKYSSVTFLSVEVIDCTIRNEFIWLNGCKSLDKLSYDNGTIKLKILVEDSDEYISRIVQELSKGKIQYNSTYYNIVTMIGYEKNRIIEGVYEITFEYSSSFKMYNEITHDITRLTYIDYIGTVETPVVIEAIANNTNCRININGNIVELDGIKANDNIFIGDGKIFSNGVNVFGKCINFTGFPKMLLGKNTINLRDCTLKIKYNPMFL